MFCSNCGCKINKSDDYCLKCGNKVQKIIKNNRLISLYKKIKKFVLKYKKSFLIGLILIIIFKILFNNLYDFTKISWDNEFEDSNVTHTISTTLTLNVLAFDKNKNQITDIKFSVNDGEIESDGTIVNWKLPEEDGTYTITAEAPSGKKITKKVTVITLDDIVENQVITGMFETPIDEETTDSDYDGLTDALEKELKTNPYSADSDGDGLPDKFEIDETKTDPLNKDTDGDGINDGDELDLGLDPLKIDSKQDGIKDSDRTLTYSIDEEELGVSMQITGKGNIASTTIDKFKNSMLANRDGLIDTFYNFYTTGTIESAVVTIEYDIDEITEKGLEENNLTLYYFDEVTNELEPLPTIVDVQNKTITVTLNHFSKYVIGDVEKVLERYNVQIMFVIDNSVSMYSTQQMVEAGYNNSTGATGNDIDFNRLTLTNKMVDSLPGFYQFGVSEFAGNYVNLSSFTDNKENVKETVNSMKSNWKTNTNGTNIVSALKKSIKEFKNDEYDHYIVLLTDGRNTEGDLSSSKNSIISKAKRNDVKICVIGLGNNIDTNVLNDIAETTGCDYYNANDSSALYEIYSIIGANINYNLVDTDNDDRFDGMILANSGFRVTRDGFSFENFISNKTQGHCYGMAVFAMLYYKNELPIALKKKGVLMLSQNYKMKYEISNGYNLSNTYFSKGSVLYNYKITNKGLKLFLYNRPNNYWDRIENDTLMIKKEYYDIMEKIGVTFYIEDYKGKNYNKYQGTSLNIDSDSFNKEVGKEEIQLINAIWRLHILQFRAKRTYFYFTPDKAFEELYNQLNDGTPLVICTRTHAVNAIRLIQDINNPNKFKIEVYDNNYPGEKRYIEVTRSKYSKTILDSKSLTNKYNYEFKYDISNGIKEEQIIYISYPKIK